MPGVAAPAHPTMFQKKRGHGGIEPPTSPTLKENHTTRPMPRGRNTIATDAKAVKIPNQKNKKQNKGTTGIEPVTSGSAILRSTAELSALKTAICKCILVFLLLRRMDVHAACRGRGVHSPLV